MPRKPIIEETIGFDLANVAGHDDDQVPAEIGEPADDYDRTGTTTDDFVYEGNDGSGNWLEMALEDTSDPSDDCADVDARLMIPGLLNDK